MRNLLAIIAMATMVMSCATTGPKGWDKKDKDGTLASCMNEVATQYRDPVPSLFCGCMVGKLEAAVPVYDVTEAKAWVKGSGGASAGRVCAEEVSKKLQGAI